MTSEFRVVVRDATCEPRTERGPGVDLRETPLEAATLKAALEEGPSSNDTVIEIDAPSAGRWWSALSDPADGTDPVDRVVAAARSCGHAPPELRTLAAAERALASHSVDRVDVRETRRRLAETGADVDRLREEVATIRGRLQARRSVDADTAAIETELAETMRRLTESETERVAAEQAHTAAERRAREERTARGQRLRLQDRVTNRRRDARRALVASVSDAFDVAVAAVPGDATLTTDPLAVEGDAVAAGFAAVRVAAIDAPVLDSTDRFESAADAADRLDVPVIRC